MAKHTRSGVKRGKGKQPQIIRWGQAIESWPLEALQEPSPQRRIRNKEAVTIAERVYNGTTEVE